VLICETRPTEERLESTTAMSATNGLSVDNTLLVVAQLP